MRGQADVLDHRDERPELRLEVGAQLDREAGVLGFSADDRAEDLDRPERDVRRQGDLEAAAAGERDPVQPRDAQSDAGFGGDAAVAEDHADEAVAFAARHDEPQRVEADLESDVDVLRLADEDASPCGPLMASRESPGDPMRSDLLRAGLLPHLRATVPH